MIEHTKVLGNPKTQKLSKFSSSSFFFVSIRVVQSYIQGMCHRRPKTLNMFENLIAYLFCDPLYEAHRNLKYFALLAERRMSFVEFLSRTF